MTALPDRYDNDAKRIATLVESFGGGMYGDWTEGQKKEYTTLTRELSRIRHVRRLGEERDRKEFDRLKTKYGW